MSEYSYQGSELDLFQNATNWKRYYAARLKPFISGDVLEVGAGIGGTARFLCHPGAATWTCLEPDQELSGRLDAALRANPLPVPAKVLTGTVGTLPPDTVFDTALYIDVLEHIEDDRSELGRIAQRMRPGGHVVVLAPAHNWLFSPFDRAVGHFRRYSRETLLEAAPDSLQLVRAFYLDSVGMLASAGNRALLKATYPTLSQIRFWDSTLVRASRVVDPLVGHALGKTVVAIWKRATATPQTRLG